MRLPTMVGVEREESERSFSSEMLHAISQPVTALECGLELSLRKGKTPAELRARLRAALVTARLLHQRIVEFQVLQNAGEPGDTSRPAAVKTLLLQLQEDFLPVARSAKINLHVECEAVTVYGDEAKLRNGFFYLLEFLVGHCPSHGHVRLCAHTASATALEVDFGSGGSNAFKPPEPPPALSLDLRIAQRTFQAAGGDLVLSAVPDGKVEGVVRLLLAN